MEARAADGILVELPAESRPGGPVKARRGPAGPPDGSEVVLLSKTSRSPRAAPTLSEAVEMVRAGGRILVTPGEYELHGNVPIRKSVTIRAIRHGTVLFRLLDDATLVVSGPGGEEASQIGPVVLEGLRFEVPSDFAVVGQQNWSEVVIRNSEFESTSRNLAPLAFAPAFVGDQRPTVEIVDSEVRSWGIFTLWAIGEEEAISPRVLATSTILQWTGPTGLTNLGGLNVTGSAAFEGRNLVIEGFSFPLMLGDSSTTSLSHSDVTEYDFAISIDEMSTGADLTCNWWGSESGPSPTLGADPSVFSPWATEPVAGTSGRVSCTGGK